MDTEPKQGQLDLYSSMVRVKRFTRLHHPLLYHFMSLHLCSKKVITNVWYLFCSQIQLSSLTQFQITPLSDVHNSKSSSNALCLQKKNRREYVIGKIQKFNYVYRLEIVLINAFFMNVLLAPTPKTKHDELLTLQYFLPSLRKAFQADFLHYTGPQKVSKKWKKSRHLPLGFGKKGW